MKDTPNSQEAYYGNNIAGMNQCLDMGEGQDLDSLIASARQIFVIFPAKAAGTTMKDFTAKCMRYRTADNVLNFEKKRKELLTNAPPLPIISSHLYKQDVFPYMVKSANNRDTLIVYSHREESSRLISAIKEVATNKCRLHEKRNSTRCILDEMKLVNHIETFKDDEIGFSTHRLLTCQTYEAIRENGPKLVFLNYKQVGKLQKLLAKHHCPELSNKLPLKSNAASDRALKILVQKGGKMTGLDEWLDAKGHTLDWTLNLKADASCQGKTIQMEEELFSCPDEALRVTPESVDRW